MTKNNATKSFTDIITDYATSKTSVYQTYRDLRKLGCTFQEIKKIVVGVHLDEKAFLNSRDGKNTQINVSVPIPRRPEVTSAGVFLMHSFPARNKSRIMCDALIAHAESYGWTWTE